MAILARLGLLHSQVDYLEVNLRRTNHVPAAHGRILAWPPCQSTYIVHFGCSPESANVLYIL